MCGIAGIINEKGNGRVGQAHRHALTDSAPRERTPAAFAVYGGGNQAHAPRGRCRNPVSTSSF